MLEVRRVRRSEVEAAKVDFCSFVRDYRLMELNAGKLFAPDFWRSCHLQQPTRLTLSPKFISIDCFSRSWTLLVKMFLLHVSAVSISPVECACGRGCTNVLAKFRLSLNQVAIDHQGHRGFKGAISCVQDFGRNTLFTQRRFSSDAESSMLRFTAASSGTNCGGSEFDPWRSIWVFADSIIADLETCRDKVLLLRRTSEHICEHWFRVDSVALSVIDKAHSALVSYCEAYRMWWIWGSSDIWTNDKN